MGFIRIIYIHISRFQVTRNCGNILIMLFVYADMYTSDSLSILPVALFGGRKISRKNYRYMCSVCVCVNWDAKESRWTFFESLMHTRCQSNKHGNSHNSWRFTRTGVPSAIIIKIFHFYYVKSIVKEKSWCTEFENRSPPAETLLLSKGH